MEKRIPESTPVAKNAILVQDRRRALMASLSFDQMDSRQSTIKSAYSTTCKWFLEHPAYLDWIEPQNLATHRGFLWLSGKPGAGKSTLMKFAHNQADKAKLGDEILVAFFFNSRGYELERSTGGMYRALLFQLLNQATDLQEILDNLHHHDWTTDTLCKLFLAAVAKLGQRQLKCFVDALDECDEQQIREMVVFFEELGDNATQSGTRLYMCFASRHYPTIDIRYGRRLILEDEHGHSADMAKYVRRHLRAGKGKAVDEVTAEIQKKANGVFLWVVLVVTILNNEFTRGRVFAVKKRLKDIPPRLSDLFKDILRRDEVNMTDLLLCLQWILFAVRPLTKEEFYFAMVAGLDSGPENIGKWDPENITAEAMDRFVLSSSKGLAELTKSKKPTVQFIHESVRDYLIKDNGMSELWLDIGSNLQSLSHDQLKRCCQNYLQTNLSDYIPQNQPLPKATSQPGKDLRQAATSVFPFLEYASCHIWNHAEKAVSPTVSQSEFLELFSLETWIGVSNLLQQYDIRRHTPNASLLYILAENNCP
ncbi:hypothetical protein GJ744_011839 [Endocarpon pusillum]|uniref:Nephrocystin 3-like N-terminal domain-containing protein n=1 Tax=Endocarpon pusillum TaxID=364733 RepID=A0A8H7AC25_9EURO|nr:hypothetical protein GJ744_011839 [Endocarpon pusillum]